jgi:integrase
VATNLYLRRERATGGWWMLLYQSPVTGKRTEMSLGPYELISTTQAKMLALKHRVAILEGRCPLAERRAAEAARKAAHASKAPTFRAAFDLYLAAHESGWRNAKHRAQWSSTVETYAYPVLADLPVDRIGTAEVMQVLEPIWYQKPETASRLRGRIENVLAFCRVREWRQGENPAAWKGHLAKLLPARDKVKPEQHLAALAWQELPTLYQKLAQQKDVSALALRYVLLTVLRTSEALGMPAKGEISRITRTHTLPPERTKAHRVHRTPLSTEALAVLDKAEAIRTGATYLFNSGRGGQLSDMALLMKLRGLYPDRKVTVHGLRSSFRDWCSEHGIPRELAERQLAHTVRDATEAAYLRTDALDPRRRLMERWSKFLLAPVVKDDTKVTSIEKERHRRAE